jgi:hypothetical protein
MRTLELLAAALAALTMVVAFRGLTLAKTPKAGRVAAILGVASVSVFAVSVALLARCNL